MNSKYKNPKFFKNWPDNNHCLQASLMTVCHAIGKPLTWDEINSITDYSDNLWSWAPVAVASISKLIPSIKLISIMDYNKFVKYGEQYFKEINNDDPKGFEEQKNHASPDFSKERKAAKELVKLGLYKQQIITLKEFENLLKGNLLIALIDAGRIAGKEWYSGHFVLVYDSNGKFKIHDPGLPPKKAWRVDKKEFIKAFKNELIIIPKN